MGTKQTKKPSLARPKAAPGKPRRRPGPRSKPLISPPLFEWNDATIKQLREHLQLTQTQMAQELGTRQQTISEWEVGMYKPRGGMARLLTIVAERANFSYQTKPDAGERE